MKVNAKSVIFVLVILAVGIIFVIPYLDPGSKSDPLKFEVTDQPEVVLKEAIAKGQPVFLDFYGAT